MLQGLESKDVAAAGAYLTAGDPTAWAGYMGQQFIALYAAPDGKRLVTGTLLDNQHNDVNPQALVKAMAKPMTDAVVRQVQKSYWIADVSGEAPRMVLGEERSKLFSPQ